MTIKNKKTKQSKTSQVTSSGSASTSVQKSSSSTSVQQSSNTLQKVSSGKKVRYIEVKVEEDDPLMITDISDHSSIAGSTVSEHYNSHPHYIITEAPSISDLSQTRALEQTHHVSDMAQSTSGEYVSSSAIQESSSTHQQSSKTETFQTSSTSVQQSGSSQSQSFDRTADSSAPNQTLNTGFIDNASNSNTYSKRSQNTNATNSFLQSERQSLVNQAATSTSKDRQDLKQGDRVTYRNSPEPSQRTQTVRSDTSNFYGGEGSLDKRGNTKEYSSTSQTNESKSSNVTKSSSSSYVVEIVDGKERIIDSSKREWGDAQEHASKEAYASVSGTDMKPQSAHSIQNYDMKSNYDTGKGGKKPTSEMIVQQDSKFIKDGNQMTSHSSITTEKDNVAKHQQYITNRDHLPADQQYITSRDQMTADQQYITNRDQRTTDQQYITCRDQMTTDQQYITNRDNLSSDQRQSTIRQNQNLTSDQQQNITRQHLTSDQHYTTSDHHTTTDQQYTTREHTTSDQQTSSVKDDQYQLKNVSNINNRNRKDVVDNVTANQERVDNRRRNMNQTDSSNFYGYDATIQNELRKVGDILQVPNTENINFSTKIMKSNTSSAQQASTSSYVVEIVDGKERIVDTSHREWGDNKEHSTYEKSHNVSGTDMKPQHEYSRHVLDKESHYDTGKDGVPKSSLEVSEESSLYKNGKEIASTSNRYGGDFTKKKAITEYVTDRDDVHNKHIHDTTDHTTTTHTTSDTQSHIKDIRDVKETTDFVTTEKENLTKETSSTTTSQTKDNLTTYERSTGTWNGKFVYENDDDRPKKPKQMSPFGRPEQPRHHLKRQDTEENIILSSRDIKDFTSISDLRKIIETSKFNKDVRVSNKNIVINRNIDDRILKEIIDTVKKYPFKRIEKVTFGTKINEDVKDLYEGLDTEETTVLSTTTGETTRKAFEVEKKRSQIEVTRYVTKNGITRKITTYEDAKEDDKIKTDVYVDKSALDVKKLVRINFIIS